MLDRRIEFDFPKHFGAAASFKADEHWNLLPFENEAAKANYERCLDAVRMGSPDVKGPFNRVFEVEGIEPAEGKCEKCGATVLLMEQYMGACQCNKCGQWYNLFGNALLDPEYWDESRLDEEWP